MADQKNETRERQDWIDLVRFLAMLIVMMNHVGFSVMGVNFWGGMFYVPVFFVLSGFLWKPEAKPVKAEIAGKAKRLMRPYLITNVVLAAIFLVRDLVKADFSQTFFRTFGFLYGRNQLYTDAETLFMADMAGNGNAYFMTALNSPTWFLPALFLTVFGTELLFVVVRHAHRNSDRMDEVSDDTNVQRVMLFISLLIFAAVIWHYICPVLLPWSLDALPFFIGFFNLGYILEKRGGWEYLVKRPWIFALLLAGLIVGGTVNGSANYSIGDYGVSVMLAYFNAIAASLLIMYACYLIRNHVPKAFAFAGRQTLFLLCWHYPVLVAIDGIREHFLPLYGVSRVFCKAVELIVVMAGLSIAGWLLQRSFRKKETKTEDEKERKSGQPSQKE
ncbi:MAG: acyltransferase [Lachnospiraceae bacterium]|nr:acyltransferase [Lachnospiraceae bacterium]